MSEAPRTALTRELAELIADACNLLEPLPADLSFEAPLIGPDSPLGLDSLDAVEIVVAVEKRYGVRIAAKDTAREVLKNLDTLAAFVAGRREVG